MDYIHLLLKDNNIWTCNKTLIYMQITPNCSHIALLSWIWASVTLSLSYTVAMCICHNWQINLNSYFVLCGYVYTLSFYILKELTLIVSEISVHTLMSTWYRMAVDYKATYSVLKLHTFLWASHIHRLYVCYEFKLNTLVKLYRHYVFAVI